MTRIDSIDDPHIAPYRMMKDRELAREGNRFIAEGEYIVRRLLASDYPCESVLVIERMAAEIAGVMPAGVTLYVTSNALLRQIIGFKFHSGVMAVGRRKSNLTLADLPVLQHKRATLVVCPDMMGVQNMGSLVRICAALGVDGMLLAPGYHYEMVQRDIFLTRAEIHRKFSKILGFSRRYRLTSTPLFLEFAAGMRELPCSPWSTVTYTPRGWKGPCYLIGQKYTHSWKEFWEETDWDYWESRRDSRCQNCAMHSGFEASAVRQVRQSPKEMARMAVWNFLG